MAYVTDAGVDDAVKRHATLRMGGQCEAPKNCRCHDSLFHLFPAFLWWRYDASQQAPREPGLRSRSSASVKGPAPVRKKMSPFFYLKQPACLPRCYFALYGCNAKKAAIAHILIIASPIPAL
jgi:hypothetical protein